MKTKFLAIVFFAFFLGACSKDDGSSQLERTTKLLAHVDSDFLNVDVDYNDNHTVQKIAAEDLIINFQYRNSRISTLQIQYDGPNSIAYTYLFGYDGDGKINQMTDSDMSVYEITYNETENSYEYKLDEDEVVTVRLTADDEIAKFTRIRPNYEINSEYFYDEENKGPFENTNAVAPHMLLAVPDPLIAFIVTSFTKKPLGRYEEGNNIFNFRNVYDEGGFLISRIYNDFGDDPTTDVFEYAEF